MPSKENQAFINAIVANPESKVPWGVWADHLEENGHEDLAHFIREHTVHTDNSPIVFRANPTYGGQQSATRHSSGNWEDEDFDNKQKVSVYNDTDSIQTNTNSRNSPFHDYRHWRMIAATDPHHAIEFSFAGLPEEHQHRLHNSLDAIINERPHTTSELPMDHDTSDKPLKRVGEWPTVEDKEQYSMYVRDYEKALKYSANEEWKALLSGIHEAPHKTVRYGILADWLDENNHPELAHFFREHGYQEGKTVEPYHLHILEGGTVVNPKKIHHYTYPNPDPHQRESKLGKLKEFISTPYVFLGTGENGHLALYLDKQANKKEIESLKELSK